MKVVSKRILEIMQKNPENSLTNNDIAEILKLDRRNLPKYFSELEELGLITREKQGINVWNKLTEKGKSFVPEEIEKKKSVETLSKEFDEVKEQIRKKPIIKEELTQETIEKWYDVNINTYKQNPEFAKRTLRYMWNSMLSGSQRKKFCLLFKDKEHPKGNMNTIRALFDDILNTL